LALRCGGRVVGDAVCTVGPDVVIDSRAATPGCLFVALGGERVDGHAFVGAALGAGAVAALVAQEVDAPIGQVVVGDPLAGLSQIATAVVAGARATGMRTVGVTGSSGKTSTKDLLAAVLSAAGPTVAPTGSFNNEVGVPLTAARVDADTKFLVSEMGARGIGHIRSLTRIVPPDVGVVLNVGVAHLGEFGSVEAIAQAKGELVEAVGMDGWAVLNADDERVAAMRARTVGHVAAFGVGAEPAFGEIRVWADGVQADEWQRHAFTLRAGARAAAVELQVSGSHQVANATAAAAAGLALGLSLETVAAALGQARAASRWRMEITENPGGVIVVNDAYNANPESMTAGLESAAAMRRAGGRVIAVLGDMLELGPASAVFHAQAGEDAARLGVDALIAVGAFAGDLARGAARAGLEAVVADDATQATELVRNLATPGDVVLVKASRALALESVARALIGQEGVAE